MLEIITLCGRDFATGQQFEFPLLSKRINQAAKPIDQLNWYLSILNPSVLDADDLSHSFVFFPRFENWYSKEDHQEMCFRTEDMIGTEELNIIAERME